MLLTCCDATEGRKSVLKQPLAGQRRQWTIQSSQKSVEPSPLVPASAKKIAYIKSSSTLISSDFVQATSSRPTMKVLVSVAIVLLLAGLPCKGVDTGGPCKHNCDHNANRELWCRKRKKLSRFGTKFLETCQVTGWTARNARFTRGPCEECHGGDR